VLIECLEAVEEKLRRKQQNRDDRMLRSASYRPKQREPSVPEIITCELLVTDESSSNVPIISPSSQNDDFVDEAPVDDAEPAAASNTLTQMVEGELGGEDPAIARIKRLLLPLRSSMETFVNSVLKKSGRSVHRSLKQNIDTLYTWRLVDIFFLRAMHEIRELGNAAAHDHLRLPSRQEAEKRVLHYLEEKKKFENVR
jgi:hypothetical protein